MASSSSRTNSKSLTKSFKSIGLSNSSTDECPETIITILKDYKKTLAQQIYNEANSDVLTHLHSGVSGSIFYIKFIKTCEMLKQKDIFPVDRNIIDAILKSLNIPATKFLNNLKARFSGDARERVRSDSLKKLSIKVEWRERNFASYGLQELYEKQIKKLKKISCLQNMHFIYISPLMIDKVIFDIKYESQVYDDASAEINRDAKAMQDDILFSKNMHKRIEELKKT